MLLSRDFLLVLCTAGIVTGFRPNRATEGVPPTDFTDTDITEIGVLRAVAWYMERNPLPGKSSINLESINPLTASSLFKAYFQANVSASRFEKALQEIIDGNNQVEVYHKKDSSFFFYCEEFAKSITQLRAQRDSASFSLKQSANSSNLESARLNVGKALHVLQKFYSNTNWVELGKTNPYEYLLDADSRAVSVAPAQTKTCRSCFKGQNDQYLCQGNILVRDLLTSGYTLSATCQSKPKEKCGHGGKNDATQDRPPTGGINKETSDPLLSPHYYLHKKAAELAIQATKDFFVGNGSNFLQQVGSDIFQKFFSLEGYSLTFVIDTTGSMSDDIEQVKTTCIEILRRQARSPDAPHDYILVPFNDPVVGPVLRTHNVDRFESFIANLDADGGGDCPEMSMTGLKVALQESMPRSKIFVFTDAGAKDESLKDEVKVLIDSSQSEVNYALTGYCASRKRRSVAETSDSNPYTEIADYSGGYYVMTTKSELSQVLGIVELSLNAAPVKVAHTRLDGTRFTFPVDETLSELTVSVKSLRSTGFSITVQQPSGKQVASPQTIISTDNHQVIKVSPVDQWGEWAVTVSPGGPYEVDIGGKSLLDFIYQIMEEQQGQALPIQGHPGRGTNYTVSLKLLGESKGAQVQRLVFLSTQGTIMGSVPLNQTTDALGNIVANVQASFQAPTTLLSVEGLSPGGLPFSRINTNAVNSASVQVVPLTGHNSTLTPGGLLEVSVLVVNDGPDATFSFTVQDDWRFLRTFRPIKHALGQGGNVTLTATFEAAVGQDIFASSIATFTAKSPSAQNYLKLPITVMPETALETDTEPPVLKNVKYSSACENQYRWHSVCSQRHWHLRFSVKDDHSSVIVQVNKEQELGQEQEQEFSYASCQQIRGSDRHVFCQYGGTCCYPKLELLLSDGNGNSDIVRLDAREPPHSVVYCRASPNFQLLLHMVNVSVSKQPFLRAKEEVATPHTLRQREANPTEKKGNQSAGPSGSHTVSGNPGDHQKKGRTMNPQGGKAFGQLKAQQEEFLDSLNKEFLDDPKYSTDEDLSEKLEMFKKKFLEFDLNAQGDIDIMALKHMLEKLGAAKTHLELKKMITEVTGGMSESISYRDFVRMMLGKRSAILKIILMYEDKAKVKDEKPSGPPPKKIIADLP